MLYPKLRAKLVTFQSNTLSRFFHTLKHIKPIQISYRGYYLVKKRLPNKDCVDFVSSIKLASSIEWQTGIKRYRSYREDTFTFLNCSQCFAGGEDWQFANYGKLWSYNLHYFDYLQQETLPWAIATFLIDDWLKNNPQGTPDAWESFPVSLRMVNWIKFFLSPEANGKVEEQWLRSLYQHALWLEKNIEYHLLANHYFKNGKALVFAGIFFSGDDAERWLKKGLAIISMELDEQILTDGGHFERSPMYHAMILEDCLDLFNIMAGQDIDQVKALRDRLRQKAKDMLGFLAGMTHPDGEIALFNDAAMGIETRLDALGDYFERLTGEKASCFTSDYGSFSETGYYVMAPRLGDRLIIDCGPVGPDYQPGHAHCDTLSFELSLQGQRVVVDSGCCQYVDGDIRRYNRGNAGHNTVTVDGENQSEVWGAHRCARRARPLYGRLEKQADGVFHFAGAHDGYRRLKGKPIHHRTITWTGETCLIEDRVEGLGFHDLESRLHIHPGLSVEVMDGRAFIRAGTGGLLATITCLEGRLETTEGWYCPGFGVQQSCTVIISRFSRVSLPFNTGWVIETSE